MAGRGSKGSWGYPRSTTVTGTPLPTAPLLHVLPSQGQRTKTNGRIEFVAGDRCSWGQLSGASEACEVFLFRVTARMSVCCGPNEGGLALSAVCSLASAKNKDQTESALTNRDEQGAGVMVWALGEQGAPSQPVSSRGPRASAREEEQVGHRGHSQLSGLVI